MRVHIATDHAGMELSKKSWPELLRAGLRSDLIQEGARQMRNEFVFAANCGCQPHVLLRRPGRCSEFVRQPHPERPVAERILDGLQFATRLHDGRKDRTLCFLDPSSNSSRMFRDRRFKPRIIEA